MLNCNGDYALLNANCINSNIGLFTNPFTLCPIQCWNRLTGSPQIFNLDWAAMWTWPAPNVCESIITPLNPNMLNGETYYISFDLMQEATQNLNGINVIAFDLANYIPGPCPTFTNSVQLANGKL